MNSFTRFVTDKGGSIMDIIYPTKLLEGNYCSCNTTCAWYNNELVLNSRLVNYRKAYQSDEVMFMDDWRLSQTYFFTEKGFTSRNIMSKITNDRLHDIRECKYPKSIVEGSYYHGLEDCRLVVWDNKLYAYGTRWDRLKDKGCICIYELNEYMQPMNEIIVPPQSENGCEKNWGAVCDKPFTFVYCNNPLQVIEVYKDGSCNLIKNEPKDESITEPIKGSTQLVRYSDDEYVSLVHSNLFYSEGNTKHTDYVTAFVFYDNDLNITRRSKWFVFNSQMCEFTCGLAVVNDRVFITYSQLDCTSQLIATDKQTIELFMQQEEDSIPNNEFYDYYRLAKRYENDGHISTAYVLYNYCALIADKSKYKVEDETRLECLIKSYCSILDIAPDAKKYLWPSRVTDSLDHVIEKYPDVCEFYYIKSAFYKITGNKNEYIHYKQLGDERKMNIHNYFFKYFNPNYL